ncbi:DUF3618 domain-containing protein [Agromyces marinus]|uniref:DUF3618 domain-containing protein n=1 Tax=Agromyces marinus TaxID=1389020 RepID=A0ABM8H1I0_9MICO|nr:DUF3618 domain-containing protein [Agromyces marinus]UIP57297.1 hypothetical protein DSM26151_01520 [Agromyces marinus]BDZ54605.1 hypothetical protein GCM10025870_16780 [Agromyces marinus]
MAAATDARLDKAQQRNLSRLQAHDNTRFARDQLAGTLSALEEKLNVPKRVARASGRAKRRIRRFADEQPGAAIAVAVGVIAAVGVGVWLVVRANLDD